METIYVLACHGGRFYVGKPRCLERRLQEHFSGKATVWTSRFPPDELLESRPATGLLDEDAVFLEYARHYGADRVRGGSFSTLEFTPEQKRLYRLLDRSSANCCYSCGEFGHLVLNCPRRVQSPQIPPKNTPQNIPKNPQNAPEKTTNSEEEGYWSPGDYFSSLEEEAEEGYISLCLLDAPKLGEVRLKMPLGSPTNCGEIISSLGKSPFVLVVVEAVTGTRNVLPAGESMDSI